MANIGSTILTGFYNFGKDSRLVGMSTDVASLTVRSPLTLLDKNTDKETRTHAALWQGMDYTFAIALQMTLFPFVPKVGKFLAKNVFKYKNAQAISGAVEFFNFFAGYFLLTSVLMPLINSSFLTKAANFVSEKLTGKKIMPHEEAKQKERVEKIKKYKENIRAKIRSMSEKVFGKTITSAILKTASAINNAIDLILKPITYPVTKISNAIGKLTANTFRALTSKNKEKEVSSDKDKAADGIANFAKKLIYAGLTLIPLALLGKKFGPALGKKLENFMVKENNISSTMMLIRTRIADGTAKPLILLASGAPYMAMRKFVDQIVSVIFLKGSEPLINKATTLVSKAYKLDAVRSEGFKSMLVTLFQTFFLLNIALPLFNNEITGRLLKKVTGKKDKEETGTKKDDTKSNVTNITKPEQSKVVVLPEHSEFFKRLAASSNSLQPSPFAQFENMMSR